MRKSKRDVVRWLQTFAVFVLLSAAVFGARAQSQPVRISSEPTVAPRLSELSRARYQQYVYAQSCAECFDYYLEVDFKKVPRSSRLDISNVSCYVKGIGAYDLNYLQLWVMKPNGEIASASTLAPMKVSDVNNKTWAVNHAVSVFATAGQHFRIRVESFSIVNLLGCHISGDIVTLG